MKTIWYKDAVVYQIYPRSFCDSNGDGIGDLRGIISKLDYIKNLGVNAVWLSPIYKSPNDDNGYDISNYRDIMDEFGTMADFDEMLAGMHERGIKLIMDLVANHTSDEHEWFVKSRESKDNPYRDYYIWRKGRGKDGRKPPNNWTSRFGGSAWAYDEKTGEWYLHLFSKKQPDLNWENPAVRREIADICNFWMDKGVDGFRCDVITYISKADGLPKGKFNPIMCGDEHFVLGPRYHEFIRELNENSWSKYDSYTVGESTGITFEKAPECIDERRRELDTIFGFEHMCTDMYMEVVPHKFKLPRFTKVLSKWQSLPDTCWNTLFLENHDQPRSLGRFTGDFGEISSLYDGLFTSQPFTRQWEYGSTNGQLKIKLTWDTPVEIKGFHIYNSGDYQYAVFNYAEQRTHDSCFFIFFHSSPPLTYFIVGAIAGKKIY